MQSTTIALILLARWICAASAVLGNTNPKGFANYSTFIELRRRLVEKNTLPFNMPCSFIAETSRESIALEVLEMSYAQDFREIPRILEEMNFLIKSPEKFCLISQGMRCNGSSDGVCNCPQNAWMGMHVETMRERGNGDCRLTVDSDCLPLESHGQSLLAGIKPNLKCESGAQCVMKGAGGGQICTEERIRTKLLDVYNSGGRNASDDPARFMRYVKRKFANGFCICSGPKSKASRVFGMNSNTKSVSNIVSPQGKVFIYLAVMYFLIWRKN